MDVLRGCAVSWPERVACALSLQEIFWREFEVPDSQDPATVISPCRSKVVHVAEISRDGAIPEKKFFGRRRYIPLRRMIPHEEAVQAFRGGQYLNLYLAPWDYHFLIFPVSGRVTSAFRLDGFSWPVVAWGGAVVRNAKLVCLLDSSLGFPVALVMVASWMVAGLEPFFEVGQSYSRAQRLGRFRIGSTVILLFPAGAVEITCHEGQKLQLGEPVARVLR